MPPNAEDEIVAVMGKTKVAFMTACERKSLQ